ncbi:MAG: hypothetical protein JMN25_15785 [gamma proteobacterium endosymbiont of Lamellibrachia anaximandri]|nr:hypothetical protein [gamma proteobacterium endosymbiont of Lamellibrachia anaximandri]
MAMKWRKKVILAKIETTYGVDAVPIGAANAIQITNVELNPMEGDTTSRNLVRPTLGNDVQIHVGTHVKLSFDVEVAGSGVAGTAPKYGVLLRGCGLAETVNVDNVEYDPVSSGEEALTIYLNIDGQRHPMIGSRGTVSIKLDPKGLPYYHFEFTGLWVDPASAAMPVPDFSGFTLPLAVTNDNTPTFTLHGLANKVAAFNFDQNNGVFYDNLVGEEAVDVNDRKPSGGITIEAPTLATKNWFTTAKASTLSTLQFVHGITAGNIVQFDAPQVQVLQPKYSERNGKVMMPMGLSFIPTDAGDDEFKITVK